MSSASRAATSSGVRPPLHRPEVHEPPVGVRMGVEEAVYPEGIAQPFRVLGVQEERPSMPHWAFGKGSLSLGAGRLHGQEAHQDLSLARVGQH